MSRADYVRAGEVLTLMRRAVDVDPTAEYREIGIRSFGNGIFHKEPVTGTALGNKRVFRIEPGDLVISNVFAWEGAIAVASEAEVGMVGSHRFMTFVPKDDRVDLTWVASFLLSEQGLDLVGKASPGSAGRNRTLAIDRFQRLELPVPPIEEQRRFSERMQLMARASRSLAGLEAQSDRLRRALSSALRQPTNDVPWTRLRLGEVLELRINPVVVDPADIYPMAGVYSFGRGLFGRADLEGSKTSYRVLHQLSEGQLVMSRLKAWEGAFAVVPFAFDGWFLSPEFPTFDVDGLVADKDFLGSLLTDEAFWGQLKGATKGIGARKERVNAERLLQQEVLLPPLAEQRRLVELIEAVRSIDRLAEYRAETTRALVPSVVNQSFAALT